MTHDALLDATRRTAASVALSTRMAMAPMLPALPSDLLATSLGMTASGLRVAARGLSARGGLPWRLLDRVYPEGDQGILGGFRASMVRRAPSHGWHARVILTHVIGAACDPAGTSPASLRTAAERAAWDALTRPQRLDQHATIEKRDLAAVAASIGLPDAQAITDWAVDRLGDQCREWANGRPAAACALCTWGEARLATLTRGQLERLVEAVLDGDVCACPAHHARLLRPSRRCA